METIRFDELGLSEQIVKATVAMGFEEASPIQAKAIPRGFIRTRSMISMDTERVIHGTEDQERGS